MTLAGYYGEEDFQRLPQATFLGQGSSVTAGTTISGGSVIVPRPGLVVGMITGASPNSFTFVSASFGGQPANVVYARPAGVTKAGIAARRLTPGTHNISFTLGGASGSSPNFGFGVWLLEHLRNDAPISQDQAQDAGATTLSVNLSVPTKSITLLGAYKNDSGITASWVGALERADFLNSGRLHTRADYTAPAAEAPHTTTVNFSGGSNYTILIGAAWR